MNEACEIGTSHYLSFTVGDESFALDIGKVQEVLEFTSVTKVPRTPDFMRGVINLRGTVVPVVDLRLKFGLSRTERALNTCIIITEVDIEGAKTVMGALADSVQEVLELDSSHVDPPPRIGTKLDTSFIRGMGKREDKLLMILEIDRLFTSEEAESVRTYGGNDELVARAA